MKRYSKTAFAAAALATTILGTASLSAQELPKTIAWSSYGVGGASYNQAVAIGKAMKEELGVNLRILPGKNDIARTIPARAGKVHAIAGGVASYFAQEGVFDFSGSDWGPQPIRIVMTSIGDTNLGLGVANDIGVKTLADLKGKRVARIKAAAALNYNTEALLASAGLTWDDVEVVEFSGFGDSWDGIISGKVDAAFALMATGRAYQLEASPRGLIWPEVPESDTKAWAALKAKAPYFVYSVGTEGAGVSPEKPHHGALYPMPQLMVYANQDDDLVYAMTKAMVDLYPSYKDGAPGASGWALERQNFKWAVPYHDGAIRLFKEKGVWTDEMQAHNDGLIKRQDVLAAAWTDFKAGAGADLSGDAFEKAWLEARAAALTEAGMEPVFK
ncbi:TAXI family TRAP transporter solute-binding subunit [Stappia taiwanensis]|uniref:TAXI family TRAP transporter solute-binding subunit n=1 Tax=Stappia taiwanensis TaxID=992267 RepID=A0A838XNN2_9HYPH|nr:TAXI family TRAP transporter solute-binding subunit [Stappia taiwanensis]MBA4610348.1 TAXI family TRAP transporter solute-binding subunit [Stappia taiwanensis]GGE78892.1 C4-dicarboxylate ABC transporter [Stappia taiwanensis]